MKTNNPVIAYGLVFISIAWAIAAVIIGLKYPQKSFLVLSFLAVLALLCVISGIIIAARLLPDPDKNLIAKQCHRPTGCGVNAFVGISRLFNSAGKHSYSFLLMEKASQQLQVCL